eukprot:4545457-Alexandrium_andersonii.AAC.1
MSADALVDYIGPGGEEIRIACPSSRFGLNVADSRAMMFSLLALTVGSDQGLGDVEHGELCD